MLTYKKPPLYNNIEPQTILRSDGWIIPFDPANTEYQAYLKWVEAGNQPLPADK
jgi:hypothetical protein